MPDSIAPKAWREIPARRASSDWVIEQATRPKSQIGAVETRKLDDVAALFSALEEDPSILMQNRVRLAADRVFAGWRDWGRHSLRLASFSVR